MQGAGSCIGTWPTAQFNAGGFVGVRSPRKELLPTQAGGVIIVGAGIGPPLNDLLQGCLEGAVKLDGCQS